ncbi:hypothetical protein EV175_004628 [Coemansia sp. RSA 1933]|nr:hypothetical protein EV175_004628 [Coemansia sp. RSA 1933]
MDQDSSRQEQPSNQPPEVVSGQQVPELNTLNPPLNHRTRATVERTDQSRLSSPEGQQFHNEENVGEEDALGLGGDYDGNEESGESTSGSSTDDEAHSELSYLVRDDPYTSQATEVSPQLFPEVGGLGPLTISDDVPGPQAGTSGGGSSEHCEAAPSVEGEEEEEYISINTQMSPRIHRRAAPSRTVNASRAPITVESSSSSSSGNQNGTTMSAAGIAAEKRRQLKRESTAKKRRRKSGLSAIAEDGESETGASANAGAKRSKSDGSHGPRPRIMFKCAVCLDLPDPAVFIHPCGHVFCEGCAQGAAQTTMRCPVCRHHMRPRDIRVLQFRIAKIDREKGKA